MLSKYLFSEWRKEERERGREKKKSLIQIELEKLIIGFPSANNCVNFITYSQGDLLSPFLGPEWRSREITPEEEGASEKQHQAYRVRHYLRVNKLEIWIPCQKHEQKELGNDYFLFSWRSREMCYRANMNPKYWSVFMPQEPNTVCLPRPPVALALGGRPLTEWGGNSSINTCFL